MMRSFAKLNSNFNFNFNWVENSIIAKLSQAKPQLQLSWLALASLNFT